jgi:hypothetical protein
MDSFPFSYMAATPFQIFSLCLAETPPDEVTFKSGLIMAARESKGQEKSKQNIENPRRSCRLRPSRFLPRFVPEFARQLKFRQKIVLV